MRKIILFTTLLMGLFVFAACNTTPEVELQSPTFANLEVNGRNPVGEDAELNRYIVNRNENIRVEIFLNNPDNLPINAVSINGVSYRSHRFASGTTNSRIIIDFSAGNTIGSTIYVLESIEYSVRGLLQTLTITQQNRYQVEVLKNMPVVRFDGIQSTTDTVSVSVFITDNDFVITSANLRIIYGDQLMETAPLNIGFNQLVFEGLFSNKEYSIEVSYLYDLDEGQGLRQNAIASTIRTGVKVKPTITLDAYTIANQELSIRLDTEDISDVLIDNVIVSLYQDGVRKEVQELSLNQIHAILFTDLLAGTSYRVEIEGSYNLNEDTDDVTEMFVVFEFATEELELPSIVLEVMPEQTRLNVIATYPFLEDFIDYESLVLTVHDHEGEIVAQLNHIEESKRYSFFRLWSGYEYTINITGLIDYGDGQGFVQDVIYSEVFSTVALAVPTVSLGPPVLDTDEFDIDFFTFNITHSDPDLTLLEVILEIYAFTPLNPDDLEDDFVFDPRDYMINAVTLIDDDLNETIVGQNILTIEFDGTRTFDLTHTIIADENTETEYLVKVYISYDLRNRQEPIQQALVDIMSFVIQTVPTIDEIDEE